MGMGRSKVEVVSIETGACICSREAHQSTLCQQGNDGANHSPLHPFSKVPGGCRREML